MKKILLMITFTFIFAFINLNAQENTVFVKASDTAGVQKIVIPNEVYNEKYTLEQNEQAFISGSYLLPSEIFLEFDGFYSQKIQEIREIRYEKGKKIQLVTTKIPLAEKKIAWVIIFTTFLCYTLFSYLFRRFKKDVAVVAVVALVAALALAVAVAVSPAVAAAAAVAVAATTVGVTKDKYFYNIWIICSVIAMSIVWYLFTPLFLVCSVAGILVGYLLGSFKKEQLLSDGPVK